MGARLGYRVEDTWAHAEASAEAGPPLLGPGHRLPILGPDSAREFTSLQRQDSVSLELVKTTCYAASGKTACLGEVGLGLFQNQKAGAQHMQMAARFGSGALRL